ncbi:hypothetical protein [Vallitalea maricola]|uniref:Uncharacterized protein n=1 Tax=Vallitalea maricola TaxID=3074433 RepID=A0ACB5UPJ3_9FIRM|nr:hypothetical protein AN2V17_37060 [Vallitalea sp. AN17-2]
MINCEHVKADYKQIFREKIMLLLFILPVILICLLKIILIITPIYIEKYFNIDITDYHSYIISVIFLMIPSMIGTVAGFMMLDDKDGKIFELMSITPIGRNGYLYNRLLIPIIITFIYSFLIRLVIGIASISYGTMLLISILLSIQTIIIGLIMFDIADDKVKGLTYAKGLNIIMIFGLADLLNNESIVYIAMLFPSYWITRLIKSPSFSNIIMSLCIHLLWLFIILGRFYKKKK